MSIDSVPLDDCLGLGMHRRILRHEDLPNGILAEARELHAAVLLHDDVEEVLRDGHQDASPITCRVMRPSAV